MNGNILTQTSRKVKSVFANPLWTKQSVLGIITAVGLLALVYAGIAATDSGWGSALPSVYVETEVSELQYTHSQGIPMTWSNHQFSIKNYHNFGLGYRYEFQHALLRADRVWLAEHKAESHGSVSAMGDDQCPGTASNGAIHTLDLSDYDDGIYILGAYTSVDVWKANNQNLDDSWKAEDEITFTHQ